MNEISTLAFSLHNNIARLHTLFFCMFLFVFNPAQVQPVYSQNANERDIQLPKPANSELTTLYLIGDSTVRNGNGDGSNNQWGWGDFMAPYFDSTKINVVNRAIGGRSSRTYITQGYWEQLLTLLKPGDVVMIQFGHNDGGAVNDTSRARGVLKGTGENEEPIYNLLTDENEVVYTYGAYLRTYISDIREKGATAVICSLVPRNYWRNGSVVRNENEFARWAEEVAKDEDIAFVDLNRHISRNYDELGPARVNHFFADDNTHTNRKGAKWNAAMVIGTLKGLKDNPLESYFSDKASEIMPLSND